MNQPIEDRVKKIEERQQKAEEKQEDTNKRVTRVEQQTEEIKALDPGSIHSRLDNHAELMREQEQTLTLIYTDVGHMKTDIGVLKTDMDKVKAEVLKIRESQADFRDTLKKTATKEDIATQNAKLDRIIAFLEKQGME